MTQTVRVKVGLFEVIAATDAYGRATVRLPFVPDARNIVEVAFDGDTHYEPASGAGFFEATAAGQLPRLVSDPTASIPRGAPPRFRAVRLDSERCLRLDSERCRLDSERCPALFEKAGALFEKAGEYDLQSRLTPPGPIERRIR